MKSIPKSWLIKPDEEETMHLIRELEKVYKEYYKNDDHSEVIKKIKRLGELGYPRSIEVLKKIAETFSAFHIYDVAEAAKEAIEIIKDSKRNFLSKLIRRLLTPKPKSYEICTACGRKLDISEQAYVHKERIVCGNCNTRKREDEEETKRKLVEAQELMKQGNPFDARLILGRYDFRCETELWRQLQSCSAQELRGGLRGRST